MAIKKALFNIKGMTRDLAASKFSPQFAYENNNLRIMATDDNTTLALVNEKGNREAVVNWSGGISSVAGTPIGQAVIDDNLVLFTTDSNGSDNIYKFTKSSTSGYDLDGKRLFTGDLDLNVTNPLETLVFYENDEIKRVYWTDNLNQPRVINIAEASFLNPDKFNFVRKLPTYTSVSFDVEKATSSSGVFAPGIIQYYFTFFDSYGQETNIAASSPLLYISYPNRGASQEDTISNSFSIHIQLPAQSATYDYIRVYSVLRTSLNSTPQVRKVIDLAINKGVYNNINYVDTGIGGEAISPTDLFFIGGEPVKAQTIAQKDNTLFLGNIETLIPKIDSSIKTLLKNNHTISFTSKGTDITNNRGGFYYYTNQLVKSQENITSYKYGEIYRFGIQFLHETGRWSEVIYLGDYKITQSPDISISAYANEPVYYHLVEPIISINESSATGHEHDVSDAITALRSAGYIAARPVVVYPGLSDRNVICQGVVCPTVYNVEDRYKNGPFAQSSWFTRPFCTNAVTFSSKTEPNNGRPLEFRHNSPIPGNDMPNAEIQCISDPPGGPFLGETNTHVDITVTESSDSEQWVADNRECYFVDQSIFTLHSPDIEFDTQVRNLDMSNLKFRIVGNTNITGMSSDISVETSTIPLNYVTGYDSDTQTTEIAQAVAPGFVSEGITDTVSSGTNYGWRGIGAYALWLDELYGTTVTNKSYENIGFMIYPWQRNGSLNNQRNVESSADEQSSLLSHKKSSILRFGERTEYFSINGFWKAYDLNLSGRTGISGAVIFDSNEVTMVKLPKPENSSLQDITYYGNIDKLLLFHIKPKTGTAGILGADTDVEDANLGSATAAYPIVAGFRTDTVPWSNIDNDESYYFRSNDSRLLFTRMPSRFARAASDGQGGFTVQRLTSAGPTCATDPVSIKYKSTPHAVIALNYTSSGEQRHLPELLVNSSTSGIHKPFWYKGSNMTIASSAGQINPVGPELSGANQGFLWIGELYREDNEVENRFGGTSDEAIANNTWVPANHDIYLLTNSSGNTRLPILEYTIGDTYFQRYDCLKTYPFTMEDQNSVVDIISFMCETHVNIDGRYDRNRGQASNLMASPKTFNLLNPAYSQLDNFFTYRATNPHRKDLSKFNNVVTWTKTKTSGELIDTWTNITLASTLEFDGDKGQIRDLENFNNNIIVFQDSGISQLLYNESVQIASTTGVPIEIANSGKVSGKRYISNHIGCTNKWSICSTPNGIYFLDSLRKDIYLFNQQLNNLSDSLGFHSWVIDTIPDASIWNPQDFDSFVTLYDRINGDVLFTTKQKALAYSEPLGQFSSFYSYGNTPYFGNIEDIGIAWHLDTSETPKYVPWLHREGDYNKFYGVYEPYGTTVVVNPDPTEDKIFNNLEFRADSSDESNGGKHIYDYTFNTLHTWNEYQEGITTLSNTLDRPSTLKKKFRVWRANIPRWNVAKNEVQPNYRDRMRNPWLYLKLSMEAPEVSTNSNDTPHNPLTDNYKTVLHDLVVDYFE